MSHHAEIIHSNLLINLNSVHAAPNAGVGRYLYTSSACVYPAGAHKVTDVTPLRDDQAYPADPEDAYGWAKLTSKKIVHYYNMEGLLPVVRSVRFHNVYGPRGTWNGGREKAPAALWRKVAVAVHKGDPSKSGVTASRLAVSCTPTTVSRVSNGSWTPRVSTTHR